MRLEITENISILESELEFQMSHSGGPGGQNVNKVSSRVMLRFNLLDSPHFSNEQKRRIQEKLGKRITQDGWFLITANRFRSQPDNRKDAMDRFVRLIRDALQREPPRYETNVPRGEKAKRLDAKRKRSQIKTNRGSIKTIEDA